MDVDLMTMRKTVMQKMTWSLSKGLTGLHCSHALSQHASVPIYLLHLEALVCVVDLFSASETTSVAIGKGLILCKCMQITVTQNSIHNRSMQIMFAKQAYWKDPYFLPPHLTSIPALSTSSQTFLFSLVLPCKNVHVLFLVISPSPPF